MERCCWLGETDGAVPWASGTHIRLIHVPTDHALHSHAGFVHPQWTMGQQEVTGFLGRDDNDLWFATDLSARDSRFITQSVPTTLEVGQTASVEVAMRNLGTETWTPGQYRLGSQNPQDNGSWGLSRGRTDRPVPPGQSTTFQFTVTARTTLGTVAFQWRMLQENITWFGEYAPRSPSPLCFPAAPRPFPTSSNSPARLPPRRSVPPTSPLPLRERERGWPARRHGQAPRSAEATPLPAACPAHPSEPLSVPQSRTGRLEPNSRRNHG
jgi:hypothetical protein